MARTSPVCICLVASLVLPAAARAEGWHICNHTPEGLNVAIAYKDTQDQWISKGWHSLNSCGGFLAKVDPPQPSPYLGSTSKSA